MSEEKTLAEAIGGFAESTRDAIVNMGRALEMQDENLTLVTRLVQGLTEWVSSAQEALLTASERIGELDDRVAQLERDLAIAKERRG